MHQKFKEKTMHWIQQLKQLHFFPWLRNQSCELENIPGTRNPGHTHTDVNDWNALIMVGCLAENQFWSNYKSFWINSCMANAARLAKSTVCGGGSSAAQNQKAETFPYSKYYQDTCAEGTLYLHFWNFHCICSMNHHGFSFFNFLILTPLTSSEMTKLCTRSLYKWGEINPDQTNGIQGFGIYISFILKVLDFRLCLSAYFQKIY